MISNAAEPAGSTDSVEGLRSPRRPATEDEARAMASAIRLHILRICLDQPLTNQQLAERLGRDPASVLYHVRRLVRAGFLVPEPARRGSRGAREVPYRATGKSWVLDVVDPRARRADNEAVLEAFLADVQEVGLGRVGMSRLGVRLTEQDRGELFRRLEELLDEYARRERAVGGEPWALFVATHPDVRAAETPVPRAAPRDNIGGR